MSSTIDPGPTSEPERHVGAAAAYTVGIPEDELSGVDTSQIAPGLRLALRDIARTGQLLIGCDYDGTLSPIVNDPNQARPLPEAVNVLRHLASLPATTVVVVSGRALRDLAAMSRLPAEIQLVGSHGAEFDLGAIHGAGGDADERLARVTERCVAITENVKGVQLELKPAAVAVHVRRAADDAGEAVIVALHEHFDNDPEAFLKAGKKVLEISIVDADKGSALRDLREINDSTAALFIGDDVTDEHVFETLTDGDMGIKVGEGATAAGYRIDGPQDVIEALAVLGEEREAWLAGASAVPIEDHALLGDGIDIALLTPDGSINWLCHPGPDAPAIFAGLLGDPEAGHLTIKPVRSGRPLSQNYVNKTMTVATKWAGVTVTDYLDYSSRRTAGQESQLRLVRSITGTAPVWISFAPRPQFGAVPVSLEATNNGIRVMGTSDPLVLFAPGLDWEISHVGPHPTASAIIDPAGGTYVVELRSGTNDLEPHPVPESDRREFNHDRWQAFVGSLELPEHHRASVVRSALTLKALCYEPTGAALAAATTSLPEWIGGIRNWDYRYCWLRDAAMTVGALSQLGSTKEADAFMDWLSQILDVATAPDRVHPLYTLEGTILGPEAVVDTLPGYAGSRPVRIGNAAQGQVQLDVFGPICAMVAETAAARGFVTGRDLETVNACVEAVARRWREPDHGIWEIRDAPREHVHSRVMCWMAVDQAIQVIAMARAERSDWVALRELIRQDILTNGWDSELNTFISAYGRTDVDAGVLAVITSGMIEGSDPRAIGTIRAVEASLRDGPTVYRYRHDDGLPGTEGGMNICTSWLVEAYSMAGLWDEAHNLFAQYLNCAGTTGLLPEMYNPGTDRGLGNHPQAYSHLGLIRCAMLLENSADTPL